MMHDYHIALHRGMEVSLANKYLMTCMGKRFSTKWKPFGWNICNMLAISFWFIVTSKSPICLSSRSIIYMQWLQSYGRHIATWLLLMMECTEHIICCIICVNRESTIWKCSVNLVVKTALQKHQTSNLTATIRSKILAILLKVQIWKIIH